VCESIHKEDIETDLRAGDRPPAIALKYPDLSEGSIRRHSQHMEASSNAIVVRRDAESALQNVMQTAGLISELSELYASAEAVGTYAMNRGSESTALKALQTRLSVLDSVIKLRKDDKDAESATANASAAEDLRKLTTALRVVLPKFPQAGESLAVALENLAEYHAAAAIRQLSK
jgi:hypothetical protein